jgi:hypothetical protein
MGGDRQMAGNRIYVQGSYIDVHDNENVYLSVDKAEVRMGQTVAEEAPATLTADLLDKAVGSVKEYIWGNAAYAVLFCVCRDEYGWQDNASYFERQLSLLGINIPAGTLNAAISRNPYMRQPVGKWKALGVMERVMVLVERFREQVALLRTKA